MFDLIDAYDKSATLFLNYDGGAWVDGFWYNFSGKFIWIGVYIVILSILFKACRPHKEYLKTFALLVVCTAIIIALSDQISSGLIKHLVERPRPSHNEEIQSLVHIVNDYRGGAYGFVSSHAANSVGLAVWLGLLFNSSILRSTLFGWTIAICYSRIYLGVHYLGDIIGGLAVGILCALFVHYVYKRIAEHNNLVMPEHKKEPWQIPAAFFATIVLIIFL